VLRLLRVRIRGEKHACRKGKCGRNGRDAVCSHLNSSQTFQVFCRTAQLGKADDPVLSSIPLEDRYCQLQAPISAHRFTLQDASQTVSDKPRIIC
jgi:hypothetical protein